MDCRCVKSFFNLNLQVLIPEVVVFLLPPVYSLDTSLAESTGLQDDMDCQCVEPFIDSNNTKEIDIDIDNKNQHDFMTRAIIRLT
jgi:hypothetical protein